MPIRHAARALAQRLRRRRAPARPALLPLPALGTALGLSLALLSACQKKEEPPSPFVGLLAPLKDCRARYTEIDARVDAAGVRDSSYFRVPGYPYLRTDRTLASFRNEISTIDEVGGWLRHMREFDQEAREFEYSNLGLSEQERAEWRYQLLTCGRGLASIELGEPEQLVAMLDRVEPPAEYSATARTFGLYPLAVPLMKSRIAKEQAAVKQEFARPLADLDAPGPLVLWKARDVEDRALVADGFAKAMPDELGFPGLVDSAWRALAEIHAPKLWIETRGDDDRPGSPKWAGDTASVDPAAPVLNYQITFTRFGDQRLVQINYFTWFKGSGADTAKPGSDIDGMIWRVTLDADAKPLVYESLHASGRQHQWFPAQNLTPRPQTSYWSVPPLIPQDGIAAAQPALRLQSGTHALRRVVSEAQAQATETRTYELRRYEELFTLPKADGGTRNLFGPDGQIPQSATRAADAAWLWSSGVTAPGALRVLGHHTTDYVGRGHFDDAYVLESAFVPPAARQARNDAPDAAGNTGAGGTTTPPEFTRASAP